MELIKSFTVDHMTLMPGVYVSRVDAISSEDAFTSYTEKTSDHGKEAQERLYPITTYDIRMTRPNFEPVMGTGEIHTIEHLGATWLRNQDKLKNRILYWGPMGCRTGFYLIMSGTETVEAVTELMKEMYAFIRDFEGDIPGAKPEECGNYSDMDLEGARMRAKRYLEVLGE